MLMEQERQKVVDYSVKMMTSGLIQGTAGNISIYNRELGYVAITPTGLDYDMLTKEDVVIIDLDKNIIEGERKPSSECDLHIGLYKAKPDANAVVHTHSMYCTILSVLGLPLKPVHYVLADAGVSEVPVARYETYGTKELADVVKTSIGESKACLMANHGMIACGSSVESAYGIARTCEWVAEIQWKSLCVGAPNYLNEDQMKIVVEKFKGYGQKKETEEEGGGYFG